MLVKQKEYVRYILLLVVYIYKCTQYNGENPVKAKSKNGKQASLVYIYYDCMWIR